MEGLEGQAEGFCSYPTLVISSLVLFSPTGCRQCCNVQVDLLLAFWVVFINSPGGGLFFGIHCDNSTGLEPGQEEQGS